MTENERVAELIREERELVAALRALAGLERVGELDFMEEQRKEQLSARLAEIRSEAEQIAQARTERRRARAEHERTKREREQQEQLEASERAHLGVMLIDELSRARAQEYSMRGLRADLRMGRVQMDADERVRRVSAAEDMIAASGVAKDDMHREAWLRSVPGTEPILGVTYDEACLDLFGVRARFVGTHALHKELRVHVNESGEVEPGAPPEEQVVSPVPAPHQDFGGPIPPSIEFGRRH